MLAAKGVSLLLDVPEPAQPPMVVRTPNRDFACGLHLVPSSGGLYLGATNRFTDPATTVVPTGATAGEHHHLLHALLHQFRTDLRTAPLIGARWGYRPASSDGAPLIGATALPGLHLATGTYRNGILMAPAIATLITAELLGQPAPLSNPYPPTQRPNRPDIPSLLATGAAQMISVLTDPHGSMPYDRDHQLANTPVQPAVPRHRQQHRPPRPARAATRHHRSTPHTRRRLPHLRHLGNPNLKPPPDKAHIALPTHGYGTADHAPVPVFDLRTRSPP